MENKKLEILLDCLSNSLGDINKEIINIESKRKLTDEESCVDTFTGRLLHDFVQLRSDIYCLKPFNFIINDWR